MVAITSTYANTSYAGLGTTLLAQATTSATTGQAQTTTSTAAATSITLSDAAKAALTAKDFATVLADARAKLTSLLQEADRTSPLEGNDLALDLSSLDPRELYAMASDKSFSKDEQSAAALEMQRRFEAAMSGPAAVAEVTGNFTGLYRAAAAYLDALGPEEKAGADWISGRDAVTEGLAQLKQDPKTLPVTDDSDPVALYLALVEAGNTVKQPSTTDLAGTARKTLDALYADAIKAGKAPTFNKNTTVGTFIDMSRFDSRTLSAIALGTGNKFAPEEVSAASAALRSKSGDALLAGFQSAAKSSDPTAFSQNIISIFASMSTEERQAAGWSDQFYQAAVDSYQTTNKLTQMFAQAGGDTTGFMSWLGR